MSKKITIKIITAGIAIVMMAVVVLTGCGGFGGSKSSSANRNLLTGTNTATELVDKSNATWASKGWRACGKGEGERISIDVTDAPNKDITHGWEFKVKKTTETKYGHGLDIGQNSVPVSPKTEYTLSCYAKGKGTLLMFYGLSYHAPKDSSGKIKIDEDNWTKFSITFTTESNKNFIDNGRTHVFFGASGTGADISICGMKLEAGNKATEWVPAEEDGQSTASASSAPVLVEADAKVVMANYKPVTISKEKAPEVEKEATGKEKLQDATVIVPEAYVYSKPSTDSSVLGSLFAEDRTSALGLTADGEWYKISYNGRVAYMLLTALQVEEETTTEEITTTQPVQPEPTTQYQEETEYNPPTEAPTEPPTQAPTEPPTEAPTEPPTEAPTEPPTEEHHHNWVLVDDMYYVCSECGAIME